MKVDDLEVVWKALADASRRRILDALRAGPRTTGELCRGFRVSRFAVMKHLAILTRAKLVLVRRRGRQRWNHLNAVPIQQIHERWVSRYEEHWAARLLNLRDQLETRKGDLPVKTKTDFGVVTVEMEIVIKAKLTRVWQALVEETSQWWLKDFYTSPAAKGFIIEPRLGGLAYEDWGNGAGQVWYTVIGVDPPNSIMLLGHLSPAFGGPSATMLQLRLQSTGKTTVLQLADTIYGKVGDDKLAQTGEGWNMLLGGGLKAFVEAQ